MAAGSGRGTVSFWRSRGKKKTPGHVTVGSTPQTLHKNLNTPAWEELPSASWDFKGKPQPTTRAR